MGTKWRPPELPPGTVVRRRLLDLITAGVRRGPLTLISAPAGSGKSVLAATWARSAPVDRPVVWLTVDEANDDSAEFWSYLLEALAEQGVDLGPSVGPRSAGRSLPTRLAAALLEQPRPVVVVLDDFDRVKGRGVPAQIDLLLRSAAPRLRLVLATRADPALPLHRYRLAGSVTEIRFDDLAFTSTEARALLAAHDVAVSDEALAALVARTEGWAAGLGLATLSLVGAPDAESTARRLAGSLGADDWLVSEYLLAEVLDAVEPDVRDFLLRISVVDLVSPSLAATLTGRPDARRVLAGLAHANAFVEPLDRQGRYRIHRLFRELLRAQLSYESPGAVTELHAAAARWFAAAGDVVRAVEHACAAGEWAVAARLVVDDLGLGALVLAGEGSRLNRAFAGMPADVPGTSAWDVRTALALGREDPGTVAGYPAPTADVDAADGADPAAGEFASAFLTAMTAWAAADWQAVLMAAPRAEKLLTGLPGDRVAAHPELRCWLLTVSGAAQLQTGSVGEAGATLTDALAAGRSPACRAARVSCLADLAVVEALRGRLRRAEEFAAGAERLAEAVGAPDGAWRASQLTARAVVAAKQYNLPEARRRAAAATARLSATGAPALAGIIALVRARVLAAGGRVDIAREVLAPHVASEHSPRWLRQLLAAEVARQHLVAGRRDAALRTLDELDKPLEPAPLLTLGWAGLGRRSADAPGRGSANLGQPGATPLDARVDAWLLSAARQLERGTVEQGVAAIGHALRLAEPEGLRWPFVVSTAPVRRLISEDPRLVARARWLGPAAGTPARAASLAVESRRTGAEARPPAEPTVAPIESLTERETEVLGYLGGLLTTDEIASRMFISINTVKTHIRNILRKLSASRRQEAVRRGRDLRII